MMSGTTPAPTKDSDSSFFSTDIIIYGCIVGGVVVIVAAIIIFCVYQRKKAKSSDLTQKLETRRIESTSRAGDGIKPKSKNEIDIEIMSDTPTQSNNKKGENGNNLSNDESQPQSQAQSQPPTQAQIQTQTQTQIIISDATQEHMSDDMTKDENHLKMNIMIDLASDSAKSVNNEDNTNDDNSNDDINGDSDAITPLTAETPNKTKNEITTVDENDDLVFVDAIAKSDKENGDNLNSKHKQQITLTIESTNDIGDINDNSNDNSNDNDNDNGNAIKLDLIDLDSEHNNDNNDNNDNKISTLSVSQPIGNNGKEQLNLTNVDSGSQVNTLSIPLTLDTSGLDDDFEDDIKTPPVIVNLSLKNAYTGGKDNNNNKKNHGNSLNIGNSDNGDNNGKKIRRRSVAEQRREFYGIRKEECNFCGVYKYPDEMEKHIVTHPSAIRQRIWLGTGENAKDKDIFYACRITHVLNCTREIDMSDDFIKECNIQGFKRLPMQDNKDENIMNHFMDAINFIETSLDDDSKNKTKVLVHCREGKSRSVSMLCCYLMWKERLSFETALTDIRSKRHIALPNETFWKQLEKLDQLFKKDRKINNNNKDTRSKHKKKEREYGYPQPFILSKNVKKSLKTASLRYQKRNPPPTPPAPSVRHNITKSATFDEDLPHVESPIHVENGQIRFRDKKNDNKQQRSFSPRGTRRSNNAKFNYNDNDSRTRARSNSKGRKRSNTNTNEESNFNGINNNGKQLKINVSNEKRKERKRSLRSRSMTPQPNIRNNSKSNNVNNDKSKVSSKSKGKAKSKSKEKMNESRSKTPAPTTKP